MPIAENIAAVRERVAAAARRANRNPDDITLMGVSKTFSVDAIRQAYAAGLRVFGENRVQEFAAKAAALRDLPNAEWHLIGHLQTNKAAKAVELFDAVDSVDSIRMAEKQIHMQVVGPVQPSSRLRPEFRSNGIGQDAEWMLMSIGGGQ